jgi:alkylation response protein AidB-like acyl-CoA dehydrogenase
MSSPPLLDRARHLADELLFPTSVEVEARGSVPVEHLDRLAEAGLYGIFAPAGPDLPTALRIIEALAGGDLATALVWIQHHSAVRAVASSERPGVRETWLTRLATGEVRAGVALGGLRPGPPLVRARPVPGGYCLDGVAPWVTGWDLVDVVLVAARTVDDLAIWALVDVRPVESLCVAWPPLIAVAASRTVHLTLTGHVVPADRVTGTLPFAQWPERDAQGLRGNGSLSLGLADRCCRLLGELGAPLAQEVNQCRSMLDATDVVGMPAARAAASELAYRCATTLIVATGAKSTVVSEPAQKLLREATFLLVFGSRPSIREHLLRRVSTRD